MPRVKRGVIANKRRKNVLKQTKGFRWGRKSKYKAAKQALQKAWTYAYRDRKVKKRDFRALFQTRISAGLKQNQSLLSYSKFIFQLKQNKIGLNRKVLAELAKDKPEVFQEIVKQTRPGL
ncbi:50S ribosomal protein L20 [Candidatus Gribaldobacteria bacterium]|nr:50S ribosomal protein L20 [Candidatus Gribaldobacteria bacterium]